MTEEFLRLWEALQRHRFTRTTSYRGPSWQNKVHIMRRIDEVIQVADENDRYGEPHIFEEADADDRWTAHVAQRHERRRAVARSHYQVWKLGAQIGASQQLTAENLARVNASNLSDAGTAARGFLSRLQGQTRNAAQPEASSSSPVSSAHSSRGTAESSTTGTRPRFPPDTKGSSSDVADGSKGKNKGTKDFFDTNGSSAIESDSSDDEDAEAVSDDAEREWIMKIFEDFPTVIQKARYVPAIGSDDHGIMTMSNRESGWFRIDPEKLPPRIRQYLSEFTVLDAAAFPDGVYPDLSLNGGGSHRWLLATARKEFICDTSTLNELAADSAQKKRRLIQDSIYFQNRHNSRTQENFRAGPARRRPARGPRALPKCNWQFWDEPDDTNHGPQIIITEPSGASHYLIDLDTFRVKVRQRRECRSGQAASYVEKSRMTARMEAMASFGPEEMEMDGDDDDSVLPSYTPGQSTRWWQRCGRMFFRAGSQPRSLLPMYHDDSPLDPEKAKLLGYDGAQDEKPCEEIAGIIRPPGFVGALRDLACCCSKS